MSICVTLPDGGKKELQAPASVLEFIKANLGQKLSKEALAAVVDGETVGLDYVIDKDCTLKVLTFEDEEGQRLYWHSSSHILAQAVKRVFGKEVKLGIGPSIKDGFYYDFDLDTAFVPEDLEKLEKEIQNIIKENHPIERFVMEKEEAVKYFEELGETYKIDLVENLPEGEIISFYKQGDFTDLCAGPHLPSTGYVKAVKLMSIAGAYWRGSEKNKMLQRIYGTAYPKQKMLDEYLQRLEEAKRRDHRKIGRELELFTIEEEGPGFPFYLPKGMVIRNQLEDMWRKVHTKAGYQEIRTPIILSEALWHQSGHWDHYKENMYTTKIDEADFAVKPMNCPGSMLVYRTKLRSYRDLPLRMGELGLVHRHEMSGALQGLMRVRCFTQDDAHIFMTEEQIESEIIGVIDLIDSVYSLFGFKYHVELSTRPENSMGSDEAWEKATNALQKALENKGLPFVINEGDGAFYGPKIDFHLEDAIGRTWQCGTIQLDFQMPERFDLTYVGSDGERHRPVMIHRVCFGSIERFIGILIEHFAGAFPVWLAPEQVIMVTVGDEQVPYAREVAAKLEDLGIRVRIDERNEKLGYKIREAKLQRAPYVLVIGGKEVENGTVNVNTRGVEAKETLTVDEFTARILTEVASKTIELTAQKVNKPCPCAQ